MSKPDRRVLGWFWRCKAHDIPWTGPYPSCHDVLVEIDAPNPAIAEAQGVDIDFRRGVPRY